MRKDTHLQHNMTAEHAGIKKQLQQNKTVPPPYLVQYILDNDNDEVVFVAQQEPLLLKWEPKEMLISTPDRRNANVSILEAQQ